MADEVVEFIPIPGLIKLSIKATAVNYNSEMYNVLSFQTPGTPTQALCEALCDRMHTWLSNKYKPLVSAEVNFDEIKAWSGEVQDGPLAIRAIDENGNGATLLGPDRMQFEWAPLLMFHGGRGRHKLGKAYLFPPPPEQVKPNGFLPEHLNACVDAFNYIIGDNTTALTWVVASESRLALYPITAVTHTHRLTIQKRRRPDFGR